MMYETKKKVKKGKKKKKHLEGRMQKNHNLETLKVKYKSDGPVRKKNHRTDKSTVIWQLERNVQKNHNSILISQGELLIKANSAQK